MKTSDQYIVDGLLFSMPRVIIRFVHKEEERRFDSIEMILYVTNKSWIDDFLYIGFTIDQCLDFISNKTRMNVSFWSENISEYFDKKIDNIIKNNKK